MINEATLIGRVGKKDIHTIKNGSKMATLSLATNSQWTNANGEKQEKTVWHNVNFFSKLADVVEKYAHVGNLVYIKGEINHKKIETGDHAGQWNYSITGSLLRLLPSAAKKSAESHENQKSLSTTTREEFDDCEIPF